VGIRREEERGERGGGRERLDREGERGGAVELREREKKMENGQFGFSFSLRVTPSAENV
jgi:hypothetical protein